MYSSYITVTVTITVYNGSYLDLLYAQKEENGI